MVDKKQVMNMTKQLTRMVFRNNVARSLRESIFIRNQNKASLSILLLDTRHEEAELYIIPLDLDNNVRPYHLLLLDNTARQEIL